MSSDFHKRLKECCGSSKWIKAMQAHSRVETEHYLQKAREEFKNLKESDWLEAFAHHPEIGDLQSLKTKFASTAHLSSREQGHLERASQETLRGLIEANRKYKERFGFIFIVCATGRTAEEMLRILEERLRNTRETELKNAAVEQAKITELRLRKILEESK